MEWPVSYIRLKVASRRVGSLHMAALHEDGQESMVHGKNRIPHRIDRRLTGLAGPDYDAPISFGLPLEPEDSQYGKFRISSIGEMSQ